MPDQQRIRIGPNQVVPAPASPSIALTDDQIHRWAEVIADGRDTVPIDLLPADRERLLGAARQRLRNRLIHVIARAIAARIHHAARHGAEVQK